MGGAVTPLMHYPVTSLQLQPATAAVAGHIPELSD